MDLIQRLWGLTIDTVENPVGRPWVDSCYMSMSSNSSICVKHANLFDQADIGQLTSFRFQLLQGRAVVHNFPKLMIVIKMVLWKLNVALRTIADTTCLVEYDPARRLLRKLET